MNLYQATAHAFSTLSIGGFSTKNDSVASFAAVTQWTIVGLPGARRHQLPPALPRRSSAGRFGRVMRDDEFRLYLVFLATGSALLLLELVGR